MTIDDEFDDEATEGLARRPNKEQLKRETQALKALVLQLLALPASGLASLTLGPSITEQLLAAKKMQHAALKRQIKYIVGLMREADSELIRRELDQLGQAHRHQVKAFHQLEQWRDELLAGDDERIDDLVERLHADRQRLRQLVRNARRENEANKPPRSARALFHYLSELQAGQ